MAEVQWRVLFAVAVGLLLAAGGRAVSSRGLRSWSGPDGEGQVRPMTAATIVAAVIAGVTLLVWLLVWLATVLT